MILLTYESKPGYRTILDYYVIKPTNEHVSAEAKICRLLRLARGICAFRKLKIKKLLIICKYAFDKGLDHSEKSNKLLNGVIITSSLKTFLPDSKIFISDAAVT